MSPVMMVPTSTEGWIERLSMDLDEHLPPAVEDQVIRLLIEVRDCDWCRASPGQMCHTYGGLPTLRRTHPCRLTTTRMQRRQLVRSAEARVENARRLAQDVLADLVEEESIEL